MPKTLAYKPKLTQLQGAKIYAQLSKDIRSAGILDRDYLFYLALTVVSYAGFLGSLYLIIKTSNILGVILLTIPFAFFTVQIAGIMHDAGHHAIFSSVKNNDLVGKIFGGTIAAMYSAWKQRHNMHHAHPNNLDTDEDVLDFPFFSFSEERVDNSRGIFRKIIKIQPFIYFPLQVTFSVIMRVSFAIAYWQRNKKTSFLENSIYILGFFVWFILPNFAFGPTKGLAVVVFSTAFTGLYMANIFAPNHKGMTLLRKNTKLSFFEEQLATTRNVKPNPIIDYIYLGLNYQIEHHLFPNCPRNKLGRITPYVEKACKKSGIEFTKANVIESNKIILGELQRLSALA